MIINVGKRIYNQSFLDDFPFLFVIISKVIGVDTVVGQGTAFPS
jgi:hypothetical protein